MRFINDFGFDDIKRFYAITHSDVEVVRAWQGHRTETKYFFVAKGTFLIQWIQIDNWIEPSSHLEIQSKTLTEANSEILVVPPGHVNGIQALEPDSVLIVFSDKTLQQSVADEVRFAKDYWRFGQ